MSRLAAFISTLAAGGFIALQPPANALLARHVGNIGAAFVSGVITAALMGALLLIAGHPGRLAGAFPFKPEYAIGGVGGAAVVLVSLVTVRTLGVGGVIALLVAAQLAVSLLADQFRWFGVHHVSFGAGRVVGLILVVGGTVLITRG